MFTILDIEDYGHLFLCRLAIAREASNPYAMKHLENLPHDVDAKVHHTEYALTSFIVVAQQERSLLWTIARTSRAEPDGSGIYVLAISMYFHGYSGRCRQGGLCVRQNQKPPTSLAARLILFAHDK